MLIVCDIDNTLLENDVVESVYKGLCRSKTLTSYDVRDWNYSDFPPDIKAAILKKFLDHNFMCSLKPFVGAQNKIKEWSDNGDKVICMTSRSTDIKKQTVKYIKSLFPEISQVVFTPNKALSISHSKVDAFIDDKAEDVLETAKLGVRCYLISNDKTKYNWWLANDLETTRKYGITVKRCVADIYLSSIRTGMIGSLVEHPFKSIPWLDIKPVRIGFAT
jgi:uncharacterized HAD superfamily protein